MNMRELPLWLKRCLIYDAISRQYETSVDVREFEIPVDVSEKILRYLSSREQKNSQLLITELKDAVDYYKFSTALRVPAPIMFQPFEFSKLFLPCNKGYKIYELLLNNSLGESMMSPIKYNNTYSLDIGRFLSLSNCHLDFANHPMIDVYYPAEIFDHSTGKLKACEFYEHVDPPIRTASAKMSLAQRREQFYDYSEGISEEYSYLTEDETEYYIYLMKTTLLKVLPLRELFKIK